MRGCIAVFCNFPIFSSHGKLIFATWPGNSYYSTIIFVFLLPICMRLSWCAHWHAPISPPTIAEKHPRFQKGERLSRQAVRHALSLLERESLIEKPQRIGTFIRKFRPFPAHITTVITIYIDDYIFPRLLHEVETALSAKRFTVQIYSTKNSTYRKQQIQSTLPEEPSVACIFAEGIKIAFPNPSIDLYEQIHELHLSLAFFRSMYQDLQDAICIADDNYNGGYYLVIFRDAAAKPSRSQHGDF